MGGYPSNKNLASHPGQVKGFLWRDLLFITRSIESEWKRRPSLCHPDRSEAKWRDLRCASRPTRILRLTPQPSNRIVIPPVPASRGTEAK